MIDTSLTREERAEKAAKDFMDAINEIGFDDKTFANVVLGEHRTLQQNAIRLMIFTIFEMAAKKDFETDLRNQGAVDACRKIKAALEKDGYHLPYI